MKFRFRFAFLGKMEAFFFRSNSGYSIFKSLVAIAIGQLIRVIVCFLLIAIYLIEKGVALQMLSFDFNR